MDQEKIGLFIKEKRTQKNLTQKELADKLNVTTQAVSKWERGRGIPDVSLLDDLSKALDVSIVEILKGEEVEDKDDRNIEESIKYANKSLMQKINLNVMKVCWATILLVLIIIAIFISKYLVIKYKTFTCEDAEKYSQIESMNNETLSYIEILENNQGNYSNKEYEIITKNINYYKELFKDDLLIELENKNKINYKDITKLLSRTINSSYGGIYNLDDFNTLINGKLIQNNEEISVNYLDLINDNYDELINFAEQTELYTATLDYSLKDKNLCIDLNLFIFSVELKYHDGFKTLVQYGGYNA